MSDQRDRPRLLMLGSHRAPWFQEIPHLATSGALPFEVVPCVSRGELDIRLASGRAWSAVLIESNHAALDRDLLDRCAALGVAVVAVGRHDVVGANAHLTDRFTRDELLEVLESAVTSSTPPALVWADDLRGVCPLIAVTGTGGSGASTIAACLAQGLGGDVVLADFALHAEQAMLHGTPDVVPGLPELVEGHRRGQMQSDGIRALTFEVCERNYQLLLGLRRHREWAALRPSAVRAALAGLRRTFEIVVADVDADTEGEASTGSTDIEERNTLARSVLAVADAVLCCAVPTMKGVHALTLLIDDLVAYDVPLAVIQPVFNFAPRGPRLRSEVTRALSELMTESQGHARDLRPPLFVTHRRAVEVAHRDRLALPAPFASALRALASELLTCRGRRPAEPELVIPGSLGMVPA